MATLRILSAGVTTTGIELLNEVSKEVFGGGCEIEELTTGNLKGRVRMAARDTAVVLVVLDTSAKELCKSFSEDLYKSDKFYHYESDKKLASYLNSQYGLSLEVEENEIPTVEPVEAKEEVISSDVLEKYLAQLDEKDSIIKSLSFKVQELTRTLEEDGGYAPASNGVTEEELEKAKSEIVDLRSEISNLNNENSLLNNQISSLNTSSSDLTQKLSAMTEKASSFESRLKDANAELADERKLNSQQAAVLRDKENEIARLLKQSADLHEDVADKDKVTVRVRELEGIIRSLNVKNENLSIELKSKAEEVERLNLEVSEKGNISDTLAQYKDMLAKAEESKVEAEKQVGTINSHLDEVNTRLSEANDELDKRAERISELQAKVEESEKLLVQANNEKLHLEDKIRVLDVEDEDSTVESVTAELSELRMQLAELKLNIFNVLSTKAMPKNNVKVPLIKGIPEVYKNIRFQFAGNAESKRGTYKCMLNEFREMPKEQFLIVDISSETAIDYVFEMKSVVDGMSWFSTGGGVQKYLSATSLPNVKVLMPAIGYVNDGYFLTVDWARRLQELENSGYKVVLFGGDLSGLVGRVLFESFSDMGNTAVYVRGNALGSRSILANASGLNGIRKSLIVYFEFDKAMSKFYDAMSKRCKCRIISYVRDK